MSVFFRISYRWKRLLFVCGVLGTLGFVYAGISSVIHEYRFGQNIRQQIIDMDPQNPEQLLHALYDAIELNTNQYSIFNPEMEDIIGLLVNHQVMVTGRGEYETVRKSWVSDSLMTLVQDKWFRAGRLGFGLGYGGRYTAEHQEAVILWHNKSNFIWRIVSRLIIGLGMTSAVAFALPYVLVLGLMGFVLYRGGSPGDYFQLIEKSQTEITVCDELGSPASDLTPDDSDAEAPQMAAWGTILVLLASVITVTRRKVGSWMRHSISSRAPPQFRKETIMSKNVVAILCALIMALSVVTPADAQVPVEKEPTKYSAYLQFGTWSNASGGGISFACDHRRVKVVAFSMTDGAAIEVISLYKVLRGSFALQSGFIAGGLKGVTHTDPYGGFEIRSTLDLSGHWTLTGRYAARHTADKRLNNLAIVSVQHGWSRYKLHVSCQGLTREHLDHRIAWGGHIVLPNFTIIAEMRISVEDGYMTSNLDVDIPLPL